MGIVPSFISQSFFIPAPKWNVTDIPDLSGKVVIVTGGNAGVGFETVRVLLTKNATVYLAARSEQKASSAILNLEKLTGRRAIWLPLDLSDLASVRRAANQFIAREHRLDILFENAGVMVPPMDQLTVQGYDLQWGTNLLAHAFLLKLLIPTLEATARSGSRPRVVITSSGATQLVPGSIKTGLDYDSFEGMTEKGAAARKRMGAQNLYAQSKFANTLLANWAHRHYASSFVTASCNPGNIRTTLQRHLEGVQAKIINSILHPVELGALTQLYLGTSLEAANAGGKYFIPWARESKSRDRDVRLQNAQTQDAMMEWVDQQTKGF